MQGGKQKYNKQRKHGLPGVRPRIGPVRPRVWLTRDILIVFIIALFQSCSIYRGAWVEYQASHFTA